MSNPLRDGLAFVGVGTTPYGRSSQDATPTSLAVEASIRAIRDAGLTAADIDGICGSHVPAATLQSALGIPALTWWVNPSTPVNFLLTEALHALHAGACTAVLVCHAAYRMPHNSSSAARDPYRRRALERGFPPTRPPTESLWPAVPGTMGGPIGYAGWTQRYLHDFGARREHLGYFAINSRTGATSNPHAVLREPLGMQEYLSGRMIREPMCLFDMDIPVDGADAFVLTTAERARDLVETPVLVHAAASGMGPSPEEDQARDFESTGHQIVARELWRKSDLRRDDFDVLCIYDGFTIIGLLWLENLGYCGRGEAGPFIETHWDRGRQRIALDGRVLMNTHGGSLSEGGTQGSGHIREAVEQLRGSAGERQVADARAALVTVGALFYNASAFVLRRD